MKKPTLPDSTAHVRLRAIFGSRTRAAAAALCCAVLLPAAGAWGQTPMPMTVPQVPGGMPLTMPMTAVPPGPPSESAYVLGPDDQITIHVVDVPDISDKPQRIDPNGDLKLPMVGRVHASGMTIDELEKTLHERLKEFLNDPDVTVSVAELHSQTVSVIGSVGSAGVHQLRGRQTLIEILSIAGGVRPEAGPVVRVMRRPEWGPIPMPDATVDPATGSSVVNIDLRTLLGAMAPERNLALLPSDVVAVPQAELVYVIGEVGKSGAIPLSRGTGVTILEALSASGGALRTAKPSEARVLRFDATTQSRTEMPINLQKVMQGKLPDMVLSAGDILVVPDNTGRRIASATLSGFINAATAAAVYGIF